MKCIQKSSGISKEFYGFNETMMELTPTNKNIRPRHVPTPKLSERKKRLFQDAKETSTTTLINNVIEEGDEDSDLGPMSPLQFSSSPSTFQRLHSIQSNDGFMNKAVRTDFKNLFSNTSPTSTRKHSNNKSMDENEDDGVTPLCTSLKKMTGVSERETSLEAIDCLGKDNYAQQLKTPNDLCNTTDQLLRGLSFRKSLIFDTGMTPNDEQTPSGKTSDTTDSSINDHPKAKTSLTFSEPLISTKSFYGSSHNSDITQIKKTSSNPEKLFVPVPVIKPKLTKKSATKKIPRVKAPTLWRHGGPFKKLKQKSSKLKFQQKQRKNGLKAIKDIITNDSASSDLVKVTNKRKLVKNHAKPDESKTDTSSEHNKRLQRILREQTNPTSLARPINWNVGSNGANRNLKASKDSFYASDDDECEETDDDDENNEPIMKEVEDEKDENDSGQTNRKFFKSKSNNTTKKYCILSGINATLKRGCDMKLEQPAKRKKRAYVKRAETVVLYSEITNIIDRLTSPSKTKSIENKSCNSPVLSRFNVVDSPVVNDKFQTAVCKTTEDSVNTMSDSASNTNLVPESQGNLIDDVVKYRKMIPYKTDDSQKISQQESILELLISNNICNDETFKIFISEPTLHKQEAEKILDSLYCVTTSIPEQIDDNCEYVNAEWYSSADFPVPITTEQINAHIESGLNEKIQNVLMSPASQISNLTSSLALNCSNELQRETSSTSLYPIFNKDHKPKANRELFLNTHNLLKKWRPIGNQYQIDAGQKEFGMKMCPQCEMYYSAHEPEDELLHIRYHNSVQILGFKGWADERLVTEIPEWGINGRIIFVCENDEIHQKRVEDVLSVVDRDLGFATNSLPPRSLVYFGIIKNQIGAVCVAHSITKAYRLVTENGLDCCTLESYPAKMGISRIWVAPPFRNFGIATKMILSIRSHFIFGAFLSFDDIAFSSPTEVGKKLATKLSGRSDFLVYEQ